MKYTVLGLVFLLTIVTVSAAEVCVVTYYDGKVDGDCVDVPDNSDGKEVLDKTKLDIDWTDDSEWGQMICKIGGIGTQVQGSTCEYNGEFWNFVIKDGDEWGHSPVGLNGGSQCWNRDFGFSDWATIVHYCAKDNDLIGFAFGDAGAIPKMLNVKEVKIKVDGKKSSADEDGGTIKDVEPESKIEFVIEVENLYPDEVGIEIEDIEATLIIEDIDDGDEIEEDSYSIDLDTEENDDLTLEVDIPLEVEDDKFDATLTIRGADDRGIKYEKVIEYTISVEKEKHEVRIEKAELYPQSIKCSGTASILVELVNTGEKEEDVKLKIDSSSLDIHHEEDFELDNDPFNDDSAFDKEYRFTIDDIKSGSYPISIKANYDDKSEEKTLDLLIEKCDEKEIEMEDKITVDIIKDIPEPVAQTETKGINQYSGIIFVFALVFIGLVIFAISAVLIFRK